MSTVTKRSFSEDWYQRCPTILWYSKILPFASPVSPNQIRDQRIRMKIWKVIRRSTQWLLSTEEQQVVFRQLFRKWEVGPVFEAEHNAFSLQVTWDQQTGEMEFIITMMPGRPMRTHASRDIGPVWTSRHWRAMDDDEMDNTA